MEQWLPILGFQLAVYERVIEVIYQSASFSGLKVLVIPDI
jgi:hypothetical protein